MKSQPFHTLPATRTHLLPLLLAACLIAALCACGGSTEDLQGYQKQHFCAQVRGEWRGIAFEGKVMHTAAGDTPATVALTFTAPNAWQGITLTLSETRAVMSLDDLSYDLPGTIGGTWFEIPALFTATGDILSVTATDGNATEITLRSPEMGRVTVVLDGQNGTVRRIAGACGWVEVVALQGTHNK